jgi:hypothetical protein
MTAKNHEELFAELEKKGIKLGQWSQMKGGMKQTPKMKGQEKILLSLKSLLQTQLDADLTTLEAAREKLARLEHGGGV